LSTDRAGRREGALRAIADAGLAPTALREIPIERMDVAAVPLTSVRQPAAAMGALAAELLVEETEGRGQRRRASEPA
jgi:LacI family transcriptional regulator